MDKAVKRAHQFYHTTIVSKQFKRMFFAELALNFCIGFYVCYNHKVFAPIVLIFIPIVIYVALLSYATNPFHSFSTPEKAEMQFYRMIPNSYVTFARALRSTSIMLVVFTTAACVLNMIMANDRTWLLPCVFIYALFIPVCTGYQYLFLKGNKYGAGIIAGLSVMLFSTLATTASMLGNLIGSVTIVFAIVFILVCVSLGVLFVRKSKKHMQKVWFQ